MFDIGNRVYPGDPIRHKFFGDCTVVSGKRIDNVIKVDFGDGALKWLGEAASNMMLFENSLFRVQEEQRCAAMRDAEAEAEQWTRIEEERNYAEAERRRQVSEYKRLITAARVPWANSTTLLAEADLF